MSAVRDWQRRSSVLSDTQLTRYLLAAVVSTAGTAVSTVALPILVYQRSGSPTLTAALTAIDVLPYVVLGPFAGPLADRVSRRRLMVTGNCVSAAAMLSIPVASQLGRLTVPQVYVAAVATAVSFVSTDAADFGALPALRRERPRRRGRIRDPGPAEEGLSPSLDLAGQHHRRQLLVLVLARPWLGLADAVLLYSLSSVAGQVAIINGITYRQEVIPDGLQAWSVPVAFVAASAVLAVTAAAAYPALRAASRETAVPA